MSIKKFSEFIKIAENSDMDWSDKNWDEAGQDGENPPNSGLEGSSAEQMDYYAGDYGETAEDSEMDDTETAESSSKNSADAIDGIKATVEDLTERISKLEKTRKK